MDKKRLCIGALLFSVVATAAANNAMGVMLSHIVKDFSLLSSQEGLMSSCISSGALTALVIGIFLRGRVSKVQFIIGGGLLMSVMLFCKSLPMPFAFFLATCFMMGTGMGIMDSCQSSFLTDIDPVRASKNLGVMHGIFGLGGFTLPLLLHRLLQAVSWRMAYRIISLICFVLVVQFLLTTRSVRKEIPAVSRLEKSRDSGKSGAFLRSPHFLLLLLAMILAAMAQNGILVWVIRYVQTVLGNENLAPLCLSFFWVCSTVSRIFVPYLPVRPLTFLAVGSLVSALSWLAGIALGNPAVMLFVCMIAGLSSGCGMPVLLGEGARISSGNTGLVTNMLMIIKTIGQILMPVIVSTAVVAVGFTNAMRLTGILFAADGLVIAAILYFHRKHETVLSQEA